MNFIVLDGYIILLGEVMNILANVLKSILVALSIT